MTMPHQQAQQAPASLPQKGKQGQGRKASFRLELVPGQGQYNEGSRCNPDPEWQKKKKKISRFVNKRKRGSTKKKNKKNVNGEQLTERSIRMPR
jgi:hypothetical protein